VQYGQLSNLKIVADTNLWVAARYNPKSYSAKILNMVGEGRLALLWSKETKRELDRIMANVKAPSDYLDAVERLHSSGIDVGFTEKLDVIEEDPEDNKILACAKAGGADFIVSNDVHLLSVKAFDGMKIVTPKEFMRAVSQERGN